MKITLFWISLITSVCLCAPVLAQPPAGGGFAPPSFADIDKDKDGKVVKEELSGFFASRLPPGGGPGGGGPGGGGPGAGGGPGGGGFNPDTIFGTWDSNSDGAITQTEFDARPQGRGGPGGGGQRPPQ